MSKCGEITPMTYWDTLTLSNGIEMYVEYVWNGILEKFEISFRSQLLINKAMEMNYLNREWVAKEMDELARELGVIE